MDHDYSCAGGAGACHEEDGRANGPRERDVPQDRQVPGDALLRCPSPRISVFRALIIRALRLYVSSKLPKIKKFSLFLGYFLSADLSINVMLIPCQEEDAQLFIPP